MDSLFSDNQSENSFATLIDTACPLNVHNLVLCKDVLCFINISDVKQLKSYFKTVTNMQRK